eukprot:TRINITY_DN6629_c0_g1_i1.p1 TRINITY_DN6629_c0_g1~~TRINITY_DN6629_c0_g1_i1.p1  ORF type:complete len:431 (-),score=112.34 TRINITY_DN6629_c0_g1_i1:504-1796(-)
MEQPREGEDGDADGDDDEEMRVDRSSPGDAVEGYTEFEDASPKSQRQWWQEVIAPPPAFAGQQLNLSLHSDIEIDFRSIRLVRKVGEGAFSEVYEGYFGSLHVAVKQLKMHSRDIYFQQRFIHELTILRLARHPNVVRLFGACLNPPAIVTEFLSGGTLYNYLHGDDIAKTPAPLAQCTNVIITTTDTHDNAVTELIDDTYAADASVAVVIPHGRRRLRDCVFNDPILPAAMYRSFSDETSRFSGAPQVVTCVRHALPLGFVLRFSSVIAEAMAYLHSIGIQHRDLSSHNVLLDGERTTVKISDFGLSRAPDAHQQGDGTGARLALGGICHPRWRPPEITQNSQQITEKCDVFSFSYILWELLSGEEPFAGLSGAEAAEETAAGIRPVIPKGTHPQLRSLLNWCWSADPSSRPTFFTIRTILKELAVTLV